MIPDLKELADSVAADPGLPPNTKAADIAAGVAAARLMNSVIETAIIRTGTFRDGLLTPADLVRVSAAIRNDPELYDSFVTGHGDDEGRTETGFHLVQSDGGELRFKNKAFVDTVADAIYHVGFEIVDGRFRNEDGDQNEKVTDVAGWMNWFLTGKSVVFGSTGAETLKSGAYSARFTEARNETFYANAGDDRIWAGNGNDTVFAGTGNDESGGGEGNDTLYGGAGNDRLWGEEGNDRLIGGAGNDHLGGGTGNDILRGGEGADEAWGEDGNDRMFGDGGDDRLGGGEGDDVVHGGTGADRVWGDEGNDILYGSGGDDEVSGGDGADRLFGGLGTDTLRGDDGNDRMFGHSGDDELHGGDGNDVLGGGEGDDLVCGNDGNDTLYGDAGKDVVRGGDGADRLFGGIGNDELFGNDGRDLLIGGAGADMLHGGEGADRLLGARGADTIDLWEMEATVDVVVLRPGDAGTTEATRDKVVNFRDGEDKIDLVAFGALDFVGARAFSGTGTEARYADGVLSVDANGDGTADAALEVSVRFFNEEDLVLA